MRLVLTLAAIFLSGTAAAGVSHWVSFDNSQGFITIPIKIGGVDATAILDSGANANGVSEDFLAKHDVYHRPGKPVVLTGVFGERRTHLVNGVEIEIFGSEFTVKDLMPLQAPGIDFLIGMPFFEAYILQIDYPNNQMRIVTRDSFDLKEFANVRMKVDGNTGHPIVHVGINNERELWLTLDTGNTGGIMVQRSVAEGAGWLEEFVVTDELAQGINEVGREQSFRVAEVEIGPFVLENVLVSVPAEGQDTHIARDPMRRTGTRLRPTTSDGLLGYDILQHFIVTIDLKRSLVHLDPPR